MNLIQIAERLKGMPMEAVMAYANGMNPEVPPYVALGELERRKRMQAGAQPAVPPSNTVKDEVEQSVGVMEMDKQRREQAMNQLMGGIAANPVPQQMFSAAGGGLVSFATGDEVEDFDTEESAKELYKRGLKQLDQRPETVKSPLELEEELRKKYPERLGILNKPIGQQALADLQALQTKQAQEDALQQKGLRDQRKMEFFKALIDAGEATRGQKGIGGLFGGFGRSMLGAEEELGKQETAIRGRGLKREADMMALRSEIEKAQRARAEGDVQGEMKHKQAAAELANKLGISQNALLRGMFQGITTLAGRERTAEATEEAAKSRAAGRGGAGPRVSDFKQKVATLTADYVRQGMSQEDAEARATREVMASGPGVVSSGIRATTEDMKAAAEEARRAVVGFIGKTEYDEKYAEAFNAALQRRLQSRQGQNQGLGSLPPGGAPTGAPAPGAPKLPPGFVPVK
jgi:hypothetical protein